MDHPDNDVRVDGVHVVKAAGIGETVVVEEGGLGVDPVGPHRPTPPLLRRKRLHQAEGVQLVLGKQRRRHVSRKGRRRREERVEEVGGGGGGGVGGSVEREERVEEGGGVEREVVGGDEEAGLVVAVEGGREGVAEAEEGLASPWGVGGRGIALEAAEDLQRAGRARV